MPTPIGSLTTVPVKSAMTSKINWVQILGTAGMLGSFFGFHFDPVQQAAVVTTIGVVQSLATIVIRTWFTKSVTSSST